MARSRSSIHLSTCWRNKTVPWQPWFSHMVKKELKDCTRPAGWRTTGLKNWTQELVLLEGFLPRCHLGLREISMTHPGDLSLLLTCITVWAVTDNPSWLCLTSKPLWQSLLSDLVTGSFHISLRNKLLSARELASRAILVAMLSCFHFTES